MKAWTSNGEVARTRLTDGQRWVLSETVSEKAPDVSWKGEGARKFGSLFLF